MIVWDKVLGRGTTDAVTVGVWAGIIVTTYVGRTFDREGRADFPAGAAPLSPGPPADDVARQIQHPMRLRSAVRS